MTRTSRIFLAAACGLAIALTAFLALAANHGPPSEPPLPVGVEQARPLSAAPAKRYTATLIPRAQVAVSFKVAGYVTDLASGAGGRLLDRGDRVVQGQVLARLRDAEFKARVNSARFALEEARAARTKAAIDLSRAERLTAGGYLAQSELDQARERAEATAARVEIASSQMEEARLQLVDAVVACPLSGVVAVRHVERGTLVSPGTKAFTVADFSAMKALFGVPDSLVGSLSPGQALDVAVEAVGRTLSGRITSISPSADPRSKVYEVEVTVDNADTVLKDGMAAVVAMGGESPPTRAAVPLAAVVRPAGRTDGYALFVVQDREGQPTALAREVRLGRVSGSRVEILEGLEPGETVITMGATLARDGQGVRLIPGLDEVRP